MKTYLFALILSCIASGGYATSAVRYIVARGWRLATKITGILCALPAAVFIVQFAAAWLVEAVAPRQPFPAFDFMWLGVASAIGANIGWERGKRDAAAGSGSPRRTLTYGAPLHLFPVMVLTPRRWRNFPSRSRRRWRCRPSCC